MLAIALFSWWYTTAWKDLARRIERRIGRTLDFFSVGLLFRTLFDPFRQIAASKVRGSVDAQLRAWADRTFSRFFGAAIRGLFIIIGLFSTALFMVIGFVQLIVWPFIPLLPLIAVLGMIMGWTL
jgi:hypothetical protein